MHYSNVIAERMNNHPVTKMSGTIPMTGASNSLVHNGPINSNMTMVDRNQNAPLKKKTIAAYSNPRARNNRQNLIYT